MDKLTDLIAKVVMFAGIWLVLAFVIFRAMVPYLWGARSDFAMLAAVLVGIFGAVGLIWLAGKMVDSVKDDMDGEK